VSDLERVCDHLVVLVGSRVQIAGDLDRLHATHHRLTGPRRDTLPDELEVVGERHTERQSTYIVRTDAPIYDPHWTVTQLSLEDLVLAYMSRTSEAARPRALEAVR
jgi:ABC-2 type transport system ATP-binding protein